MEAPIPASSGEVRGWGRFRGVVRRLLHAQVRPRHPEVAARRAADVGRTEEQRVAATPVGSGGDLALESEGKEAHEHGEGDCYLDLGGWRWQRRIS
uniref:Uncharacterized protein n=1 Tax=Oryza brachyantha TaxID=4533 RepID=J3LX23_ORYBR